MDASLIIVIIFIVIIAVIISITNEKKRTEKFKQIAPQIGLRFIEDNHEKYSFKIFKKGHSQKIKNNLNGSYDGFSIDVFDYIFTIGYGRGRKTHKQTVAIVKLKNRILPKFNLGPESFFHRIGDLFGSHDIDFEQFPKFSKNYLLKGDSESEIRNIFNQKVIQYFEKQEYIRNIEANSDQILYYTLNHRFRPDELIEFLDQAIEVAKIFDRSEW